MALTPSNSHGGGIPQGGPLTEDLLSGGHSLKGSDDGFVAGARVTTGNGLIGDSAGSAFLVGGNSDDIGTTPGGDVTVIAGTSEGGAGGSANLVAGGSNAGTEGSAKIKDSGSRVVIEVKTVSSARGLGFYGTAPIVKPTGVAVSAAGVHAALVSLGLISA